ncbi:MAG: hypothetical protein EBV28_09200 [Betaproteobacteria bacterium]|nr:hypothetical protein [Betaproteobacteria bacterium]
MTAADPNSATPNPAAAPEVGAARVLGQEGAVYPLKAAQLQWTLADWLAHVERLHPLGIDMTLARTRAVAQRLGLHRPGPHRIPGP